MCLKMELLKLCIIRRLFKAKIHPEGCNFQLIDEIEESEENVYRDRDKTTSRTHSQTKKKKRRKKDKLINI